MRPVIATVAASTVARRLPLHRPSVREREAAIDPGESLLRNWLPRCSAREVGAPYFLLPARRRSTAGCAVRGCASAAPGAAASGGFLLGLVSGRGCDTAFLEGCLERRHQIDHLAAPRLLRHLAHLMAGNFLLGGRLPLMACARPRVSIV